MPYFELPVVLCQARNQNIIFKVWTVNKREEYRGKFQGEWRGDNIVWNNPYWAQYPIKKINSEKELPFMHRPELWYTFFL